MKDEIWKRARDELMELAYGYRLDWSDFDGRTLLSEIRDIVDRAEKDDRET